MMIVMVMNHGIMMGFVEREKGREFLQGEDETGEEKGRKGREEKQKHEYQLLIVHGTSP
jgi:hypothetical protein